MTAELSEKVVEGSGLDRIWGTVILSAQRGWVEA